MDKLKELVEQFRNISIEFASSIEHDNDESFDTYIGKRADIISEIQKLDYSADDIKKLFEEYGIMKVEEKLSLLCAEKRKEYLDIINNLAYAGNANKNYYKKSYISSVYYDKKI